MKYPNNFLAQLNQSQLKQTPMYIIYLLLSLFFIAKPTNNLQKLELNKIETESLQVVEGGIGGSGLIFLPTATLKYS